MNMVLVIFSYLSSQKKSVSDYFPKTVKSTEKWIM